MNNFIAVGIGGILGAWTRSLMLAIHLPMPIFFINCIGSFLLAWLATSRLIRQQQWHLLFTTGALGSFTTFSTFSSETLALMQQGLWEQALLYSAGTLIVGTLASALGFFVGGGSWRSSH